MSTSYDVTYLNKLVEGFREEAVVPSDNTIDGLNKEIGLLNGQKDTSVYQLIAKLFVLVKGIQKADKATLESFLALRGGLKPAREGANPYLPLVKAAFVVKVKGEWTFDRSRDKYANVLRWIISNGIKEADIVPKLTKLTMKEVERLDREANKSSGQETRVDNTREKGRTAPTLLTSNLPPALETKPDQIVRMWGVVRNGMLEVKSAEIVPDDKANSLLYKLGNTIKSK